MNYTRSGTVVVDEKSLFVYQVILGAKPDVTLWIQGDFMCHVFRIILGKVPGQRRLVRSKNLRGLMANGMDNPLAVFNCLGERNLASIKQIVVY